MTTLAIIFGTIGMLGLWVSIKASLSETKSTRSLTREQRKRFNSIFKLKTQIDEYPDDLKLHAEISRPARIRKLVVAILIVVLIFSYIQVGARL